MVHSRRTARRPFHLLAKPAGSRCNLACDYCFYVDKGTGTLSNTAPGRCMDDETLEAFVRSYIETDPAPEVEFAWQGGEPTLAGLPFFEKALALQKKHARGKIIRNALQTNGLLIDEDWARFLADNGFLVGLSVDGPAELHDRHRMTVGGLGAHARAIRAFDRLRAAGVDCNILAVVNATTALHPLEVYRYLTRELGAEFIQFLPAVERRTGPSGEVAYPQSLDATATVTDWSVSGDAYGRFVIAIFDEWVRGDVGRVFVQLFDNALAAWLGERADLCVMRPTCGASLVIEQNGDVYSCDHYVFVRHRLGNVRHDSLAHLVDGREQKMFGMAKAELTGECVRCDWRFVCQGGCPKHRIHAVGGGWHNHLCAGYRAMFAHMDPYMRFMADRIGRRQSPSDVMAAAVAIAAAARTQGSGGTLPGECE